MIVVSDASPITALLTVGEVDILDRLFGEVIIPKAVADELHRTHTDLPEWLRVERVSNQDLAGEYMLSVDKGEAKAIALAQELSPPPQNLWAQWGVADRVMSCILGFLGGN